MPLLLPVLFGDLFRQQSGVTSLFDLREGKIGKEIVMVIKHMTFLVGSFFPLVRFLKNFIEWVEGGDEINHPVCVWLPLFIDSELLSLRLAQFHQNIHQSLLVGRRRARLESYLTIHWAVNFLRPHLFQVLICDNRRG